jgi:hypothetical protein
MGSGGGSGHTTVTNQVQLPAWAQPYAAGFLGDIAKYVNQGLASGMPANELSQLAAFTPAQERAFGLTGQMAGAEAQPIAAGLNQANQILSGAYLNPASNPYLQATYNEAAQPMITAFRDATEPGIQAEFAKAGSFGGSAQNAAEGLAQQNLAQGLSNLGTNIYGGAYEQGLQNMIREQALLPSMLSGAFTPMQELSAIGGQQQQQGQQALDIAQQNAISQYNWPFQILGQLGAALPTAVGGAYNSQQTGPNPNAIDPLSGGLAGLLGVGGLLGALNGGSGINSLLGGLASLLPF